MTAVIDVCRRNPSEQSTGPEKSSSSAAWSNGHTVESHREALVGVAWRICGDQEQARDVVQDVYCGYFTAPGKFLAASSLKTYLYRMVINRSIDIRRRNKRFSAICDRLDRECYQHPDDVFAVKDLVRHLLADINSLYKVPFVLAEGDGMSYEEIAGLLNIPLNTVRSRIFRCREKLRKKLLSTGYTL